MVSPANSSFRDPAGYVYRGEDGHLYRSVSQRYNEQYRLLMDSGLYKSLADKGWLISHQEIETEANGQPVYTLYPAEIPFISYPFEWCFSQLKEAALLTLDIQLEALKHGMSLKDASEYNVTYHNGRPVFIDTLSFEKHTEGQPWKAYRQFCQHFLAPLALAAYQSPELIRLLQNHLDGVPLPLASKLLPAKSYFSMGLLLHVHLHAKAQQKLSHKQASTASVNTSSSQNVLHLITNLRATISKLAWKPKQTNWANYYTESNNYTDSSMQHKEEVVEMFLASINASKVWDIGANTGKFSEIAAKYASQVIATDFDPEAIELLHKNLKTKGNRTILPLVSDIVNPSPAIGWRNQERASILERIQPDTILALAVVHHLAIANNIPFAMVARLLASKCQHLIIEFVPKEDSQVQRMLQGREDVFVKYTQLDFEKEFFFYFNLVDKKQVKGTSRVLYLMQSK